MSKLISKELFEKVMGFETSEVNYWGGNKVQYMADFIPSHNKEGNTISIYELFFKCKEWAFNKDSQITSGQRFVAHNGSYVEPKPEFFASITTSKDFWSGADEKEDYEEVFFVARTELEAIIKACEYVLKEQS